MTTQRKTTPKKSHYQTGNSKVIEVALLIFVIYVAHAVYTSIPNPFLWDFSVRNMAGSWILFGFFILLFFKWN